MKIEKERRFLVTAVEARIMKEALEDGIGIVQGYLHVDDPIVRVRIEDDERSFLTIKAEIKNNFGKLEPEYPIPLDEATVIIKLHKHHLIRKIRHKIGRFEIDFFQGILQGLVKAEIELDNVDEKIEIPSGFKVIEVTLDRRFENQNLAKLDKLPEEWRCKIAESL